ncbi:MAG: histidine phosphatase family protein [Acidimicrobiia bacterium]
MSVLLVRHGQSTWNAEGRWQGQEDPPLSDVGERQALEAAERLGPVDAVWTSHLLRARRTAEVVAGVHGLPVRVDARLCERHGGPWQGLTRVEIDARWPGYLADGRRPDGYESDAEVSARAVAALADLAAAHDGEEVLVVTHGGVVRTLERLLHDTARGPGADLIANLGGRRLDADGDGHWELGDPVVLLGDDTVTVPGQL